VTVCESCLQLVSDKLCNRLPLKCLRIDIFLEDFVCHDWQKSATYTSIMYIEYLSLYAKSSFCEFRTLFSASACVQPAAIKSLFHATSSARTAVGLFLLLVRRSGTHYQKTCRIRSVLRTVTDSHWKHFYFCSTSVFSAIELCYENALYKFTFDVDIEF